MVEEQCSEDNLEGTQTQSQGDTDLVLWLEGKLGRKKSTTDTQKSDYSGSFFAHIAIFNMVTFCRHRT